MLLIVSQVPLNTEKCVVCEFDLVEQFQPQATLRTAEKKKCAECFSFNPPSVTFCLKCEARLDDVSVVKIRNNIEKPPPNTSMFLGDDSMVTCSKCGRVNSADARFCDWCGSKPKKTSSLINCLKCTAANEPYARLDEFAYYRCTLCDINNWQLNQKPTSVVYFYKKVTFLRAVRKRFQFKLETPNYIPLQNQI